MKSQKSWLFLSLSISVIFGVVALIADRNSFFLLINLGVQPLTPQFWGFITNLGDALLAAIFLTFFAIKRPDILRATFIATVISLPIVQGGKHLTEVVRPWWIMQEHGAIAIGGISRNFSFPSGHTATGAVVFGIVMFMVKYRRVKLLMLVLAILAGVSRIAVSAHWPLDVSAGLIVGFLSAYGAVRLESQWREPNRYLTIFFISILTVSSVIYATTYKTNPSIHYFQIVFGWTTFIFGLYSILYWIRKRV